MSEHFRAFSFVDRILADEPGRQISGRYAIPAGIAEFPLSLVSEAIGQLAAWSSMAATGFEVRPVAGIAGRVEFPGTVAPGDVLELEATLVKADLEAVGYDGLARVNGETVVRLLDTLGPMVPMADFDDPEAMRARYGLLGSVGAEPFAFGGVPQMGTERSGGTAGESAEGFLRVPEDAPFFGDHFPRKPVFPGTLLMNLKLGFALGLAAERGGGPWRPAAACDVKLRSFMPPGEVLDLKAEVESHDDGLLRVIVTTRKGKRLNSSARFELVRTS
jgi:3-hydroxymyristoyl/3-hydroxydecanoyl-(acyl carrier protein) dehydratase